MKKRFMFWQDPGVWSFMVFMILYGIVGPFKTTLVMSHISTSLLSLQIAVSSGCSLISNYLGNKYRDNFSNRKLFYTVVGVDFVIGILVTAAYQWSWISLDIAFMAGIVMYSLIGKLYIPYLSKLTIIYYCGESEEQTGNNKADYDKMLSYSRNTANIVGGGLGFLFGYLLPIHTTQVCMWVGMLSYISMMIGDILQFEIFRPKK